MVDCYINNFDVVVEVGGIRINVRNFFFIIYYLIIVVCCFVVSCWIFLKVIGCIFWVRWKVGLYFWIWLNVFFNCCLSFCNFLFSCFLDFFNDVFFCVFCCDSCFLIFFSFFLLMWIFFCCCWSCWVIFGGILFWGIKLWLVRSWIRFWVWLCLVIFSVCFNFFRCMYVWMVLL